MHPDSLQAPDDPEAAAVRAQETALVRTAMATLSPELQQALQARMDGVPVSRIGRAISERAATALRKELRRHA